MDLGNSRVGLATGLRKVQPSKVVGCGDAVSEMGSKDPQGSGPPRASNSFVQAANCVSISTSINASDDHVR